MFEWFFTLVRTSSTNFMFPCQTLEERCWLKKLAYNPIIITIVLNIMTSLGKSAYVSRGIKTDYLISRSKYYSANFIIKQEIMTARCLSASKVSKKQIFWCSSILPLLEENIVLVREHYLACIQLKEHLYSFLCHWCDTKSPNS